MKEIISLIKQGLNEGCKFMGDSIIGYKFVGHLGEKFNQKLAILWDDNLNITRGELGKNGITIEPFELNAWNKAKVQS